MTWTVQIKLNTVVISREGSLFEGELKETYENRVAHDLTTATGGRLLLVRTEEHIEAELTVYGSGIPVLFRHLGVMQ